MNIQQISTSQRGIAYLLLISQLVTSCGWNETILPTKKQERTIQQGEYDFNTRASDSTFQVDTTVDVPSKLSLPDKPQETASERLSQAKQGLPLIVNTPDQLLDLRKTDSKQPPATEKKGPSLDDTRLKRVKQKTRNLSKQNFPLKTSEQRAIKPNPLKNLSFVKPRSQEPTDPTVTNSTIKPALSYGPYPIQRGYQVKFIKQAGKWVAQVKESLPIGISREPMMLPVYLEFGLSMEEVSSHPHLDMVLPTKSNDGQGYVVCTRQTGLLGGMMRNKTREEGSHCIYREDQKVYDEGLGRWVCPGDGKHPRSGPISNNNNAPASSKEMGLMVKEGFQGLSQLGSLGGILDHLASSTASDEWRKKQEAEYQQQKERDRIERRAWEEFQKEIKRHNDFIWEQIKKIQEKFDTVDLSSQVAIKTTKKEINEAIKRTNDLESELKNEFGERINSCVPYSDHSPTAPLYKLLELADCMDNWYAFLENEEDMNLSRKDELITLMQKDGGSMKGIEKIIDEAEWVQRRLDETIRDIEKYGNPAKKKERPYMIMIIDGEEIMLPSIIKEMPPVIDGCGRPVKEKRKRATHKEIIEFSGITKEAIVKRLTSNIVPFVQAIHKRCSRLQLIQKTIPSFREERSEETKKLERAIGVTKRWLMNLKEQVKNAKGKEKRMALLQQVEEQEKIEQARHTAAYKSSLENHGDTTMLPYIPEFTPLHTLLNLDLEQKIDLQIEEMKESLTSFQALKQELSKEPEEQTDAKSSDTTNKSAIVPPVREALNQALKEAEEIIEKIETKIESTGKPRKRFELAKKEVEEVKQILTSTEKEKRFAIATLPEAEQKFKKAHDELMEFVNRKRPAIDRNDAFYREKEKLEMKTGTAKRELEALKQNIEEMDDLLADFQESFNNHYYWLQEMNLRICEKELKEKLHKGFDKIMEEWDKKFKKVREESHKKFKKEMEEREQESKKRMEEFGKELARIVEEGSKKQEEATATNSSFNQKHKQEKQILRQRKTKQDPKTIDSLDLDTILTNALQELELSEDEETLLADISTDLQQTSDSLPKVEEISNNNSAKETTNQKEEEWQDKKEQNKAVRQEDQGTTLPSSGNFFVGSSAVALSSRILQGKDITIPGPYVVLSEEGKEQQAALTTTASKTKVEQSKEEKTAPPFKPNKISAAAEETVKEVIEEDKKENNGTEKPQQARCNIGVRKAFNKLIGSNELDGMVANQMVDHWASSPNWEEIAMGQTRELALKQAHELANQGYLVVAGWHSLSETKSGHVAVVVPGKMVDSKNWECLVPMTMDTGENNRWASDMLSKGFGADKKPRIKFYRYKGPIKK